ncbi:hypothetical protein ACFE04_005823 [Oxalis oulophora]
MEKPSILKVPRMDRLHSFNGVSQKLPNTPRRGLEKQISFQGISEKQQPSTSKANEEKRTARGFLDKQKSFRVVMERQLSFIGGGGGGGGGGSEKKKAKESPGKRGDSQFHLAARAGNLSRIREILQKCDVNEAKDLLCKQNLEGETPLYAAAESGHATVVGEMLKFMTLETASIAARKYDPFHVAAKEGHIDVLREFLSTFPNLVMTVDSSCTTALHTAAAQGHLDVVNLLLEADSNLAKIAKNNGKTALHSAARTGHLEVVKALLNKDPSIGFRTDKKGQTALHMAVKGQNEEIVLELIKPDPSILSLEDKQGNTALHIATKKGRVQMVHCLLSVEGINVNAVNKAGESPLDEAEKLGIPDLVTILKEAGATSPKAHGKNPNSAKQLKQTVSDIKHDVQSQLQQTRQTGFRVHKIAKKLKKLHISGLNNAINSATVVAVLIATVAFAAIFTVPGQFNEKPKAGSSLGQAKIADKPAFLIFFVTDSLALFISLAVVVVQTSVVVIEQKAKRQLVFVINKLMWLACLCISIAFISLTYVVVGGSTWLALYTTVIGGTIMVTTIGSMCYCVVVHRMEETKLRNIRRAESRSHSFSVSMHSDPEILNSDFKRMYAL